MFDPVDPKQSFPALEHGILQYWKEEDIFKRSIKSRRKEVTEALDGAMHGGNTFSFYDGPPFATGLPHYGHLLAGTIKDVIPRYQAMKSKVVERRFGWDCHGLPVENLVEKEEGIADRAEIEKKGVRWFNDKCRASVQRYTEEWRKTVERMGRWVDMDWDYRTMDPDYMESIWWVFSELYSKGLIYEGKKSMHVCPRCVTPLSNFEVTLGYRDVNDLAVYVKLALVDEPGTHLLIWTTTTWTLPGNLLAAVHPDIAYVKVESDGEKYILAKDLVDKVFAGKEYEIVSDVLSKDLLGKKYTPPFSYFYEQFQNSAFYVVYADYVTTDAGTGVVHLAPAFGEEDFLIGQKEGLDLLQHVGMDGRFVDAVSDFAGLEVKPLENPTQNDKKIAEYLKQKGLLFRSESFTHSYPHCWRCDASLLNYTTGSWFVAVEKFKKDLLAQNAKTEWVPAHIRDGRFGQWLENARDWAISRNRYWGTPLPIWRSESGEIEVIGSRDQLMEKCPDCFTKITTLRHAESEGNVNPLYQGEVPGTDLTKRGRKQAKEAGKWLKEKQVAIIYCSPLARTIQTAEAIAKYTKAKVIVDERLREVSFGEYEGKTIDFSDLTFVKERRAHKMEKGKPESIYHFDGMEQWGSVQERVESFFTDVLSKHKGEHIVVVSHADPLVNMKHFFTGEEPLKLSHQPFPEKADPYTYFWDHERGAQLDLHKDTVDDLTWTTKKGEEMKRIPEVLDCWFESGSMPYAQAHYPFEANVMLSPSKHGMGRVTLRRAQGDTLPPGFPANFIAEGTDQTRGWFYTLMVLSTALFKKPAFEHCIVNGIVLAEDGKRMSKKLRNYPDPNVLLEKQGADAIRFTLMSSPAVRAEDLRFSERSVEETLRRVILPLWNVYSFFVLHANEADWSPEGALSYERLAMSQKAAHSSKLKAQSSHPLDQWIQAEVQDLVNRMTAELDAYDLSATCGELFDTLDALTNWYIRRSRRRFAGKEEGCEQALTTLYEVLLTFSKLLAPFCPFITEAIYLNLVPEDHGSIHMTNWPEVRELTADEKKLLEKTRLLRTIVSLGMSLRGEANIKVRQPLKVAHIALPPSMKKLSSEDAKLLEEELNVKLIRSLKDPSEFADRFVQVDARAVGPRLGKKVQKVIQTAKAGDFTENPNGSITVLGEKLSSEEAQIVYKEKEGQVVASEKGIVVSIDTEISEDLQEEGLARDVIRAVQSLRKEKGLKVSDKISLEAGEGMTDVLSGYQKLIEGETNGSFEEKEGVLRMSVSLEGGKIVAR